MEDRVTLRRLGGRYMGRDFDGKILSAGPGDTLTCSGRRAAMLLSDFPGGFEVVGETGERLASDAEGSQPSTTTSEPPAGASGAAHGHSGESGTGSAPANPKRKRKPRA